MCCMYIRTFLWSGAMAEKMNVIGLKVVLAQLGLSHHYIQNRKHQQIEGRQYDRIGAPPTWLLAGGGGGGASSTASRSSHPSASSSPPPSSSSLFHPSSPPATLAAGATSAAVNDCRGVTFVEMLRVRGLGLMGDANPPDADDDAAGVEEVGGSRVWAGAAEPFPPIREPTAQPRRAEPLDFSEDAEVVRDGMPESPLASCTQKQKAGV